MLENHPNILKVEAYQSEGVVETKQVGDAFLAEQDNGFQRKGLDYMVMEYCQNGDLFNALKNTGKFSSELSRFYFSQLLNAVEHIHNHAKVAHLDLKLENILLDSITYAPKICDFGFAEDISEPVLANKGTHGYKAPESYGKFKEFHWVQD